MKESLHRFVSVIIVIQIVVLMLYDLTSCAAGGKSLTNGQLRELAEEGFINNGESILSDLSGDNYHYSDKRYYGTYNGYIVLFSEESGWDNRLTIGQDAVELTHGTPFMVYAYKSGVFYTISEAYADGFLSDDDIEQIAVRHDQFERFVAYTPLTGEQLNELKEIGFLHDGQGVMCSPSDDANDYYDIKYYGTFGEYIILSDEGNATAAVLYTMDVAGVKFEGRTDFEIYAYKDGTFLTLQEAHEKGILSRGDIVEIASRRRQLVGF